MASLKAGPKQNDSVLLFIVGQHRLVEQRRRMKSHGEDIDESIEKIKKLKAEIRRLDLEEKALLEKEGILKEAFNKSRSDLTKSVEPDFDVVVPPPPPPDPYAKITASFSRMVMK